MTLPSLKPAAATPFLRFLLVLVLYVAAIGGFFVLLFKWIDSRPADSGPRLPQEYVLRQAESRRRMQAAADDAVRRFDAVTDWPERAADFTATLREALIRTDGRPVFFVGSIGDLDAANGQYVVTVDDVNNVIRRTLPGIRFRLECATTEWLKTAATGEPGLRVMGVASVVDLRMTRDGSDPLDPLRRRYRMTQRQYLASGRCLDLMPAL